MSLVKRSLNTYIYQESGHQQMKPQEEAHVWSYWAIFRLELILATTIEEYKETRIIIRWFYIASISMFLLKKESWVKLA